MTYYIDFDNTLFDTVSFYNDLMNIMIKYGIDEERIQEYNRYNQNLFNPLKLINYNIEKYHINKEILNDVDNHFKNAYKYIYRDVINFLLKVKNSGSKLVLLTYGDYDYQDRKITSSCIKEYFDEVIITNQEKHSLDLDYKNGVFVDDNVDVINGLLQKSPYKIIRIKRLNNYHSQKLLNNSLVKEYVDLCDID